MVPPTFSMALPTSINPVQKQRCPKACLLVGWRSCQVDRQYQPQSSSRLWLRMAHVLRSGFGLLDPPLCSLYRFEAQERKNILKQENLWLLFFQVSLWGSLWNRRQSSLIFPTLEQVLTHQTWLWKQGSAFFIHSRAVVWGLPSLTHFGGWEAILETMSMLLKF